jgi:Core-2/I-Branching enzyme
LSFCFLTQGDLFHPKIWDAFFADVPTEHFSIYCHPKNLESVISPILVNRIIRDRVPTRHGDISLVEATLALFAAALEETHNRYFILLSESTIPITSFATIRDDIARCGARSLIPYSVPAPGTEHHRRLAMVTDGSLFAKAFYHHCQWVVLHRKHVRALLRRSYLPLFARVFAPDEHYIMNVLVHIQGVSQDKILNRRTTFVNWQDKEIKHWLHQGTGRIFRTVHPKTYTVLSPSDLNGAHDAWFFRKVAASCDCNLVLERLNSRL